MPGNTYKGSRNLKGKSGSSRRTSSKSRSRRNSRSKSRTNKSETFVEAILSDMPRQNVNLTKMDQAMGNRSQNGLINPQNIEYDPLHIQYMVQQSNDMSHLNKYAYSADQIMGGPQMGGPQMMAPQMMAPQMGAPQMMAPQMGQPMMFGSREDMDNTDPSDGHPEGGHELGAAHPEGAHELGAAHPEGAHPEGGHEPSGNHEGQMGGGNLVALLAHRLESNSLSSSEIKQLRRILN